MTPVFGALQAGDDPDRDGDAVFEEGVGLVAAGYVDFDEDARRACVERAADRCAGLCIGCVGGGGDGRCGRSGWRAGDGE